MSRHVRWVVFPQTLKQGLFIYFLSLLSRRIANLALLVRQLDLDCGVLVLVRLLPHLMVNGMQDIRFGAAPKVSRSGCLGEDWIIAKQRGLQGNPLIVAMVRGYPDRCCFDFSFHLKRSSAPWKP